jgi:hypothetical protein
MAKYTLPLLDASVQDLRRRGSNGKPLHPFSYDRFYPLSRAATRYTFDKEASYYLGEFIRDFGEFIVDNREFAIPPNDRCYIEIDLLEMHSAIYEEMSEHIQGEHEKLLGFLIDGNHVYHCASMIWLHRASGEYRESQQFTPISMDMNTPTDEYEFLKHLKDDLEEDQKEIDIGMQRVHYFLGDTTDEIEDLDKLFAILHENTVHIHDCENLPRDVIMREFTEMQGGGLLRTLWAAILLIHQKRGTNIMSVPRKTGLVKGKRHVFDAYKVIKLEVCPSAQEMRKRVLAGRRSSPIDHPVKGHYAHWHKNEDCVHIWVRDEEDEFRWDCRECGCIRRYRKATRRGDIRLGSVSRDYELVNSPKNSVNDEEMRYNQIIAHVERLDDQDDKGASPGNPG